MIKLLSHKHTNLTIRSEKNMCNKVARVVASDSIAKSDSMYSVSNHTAVPTAVPSGNILNNRINSPGNETTTLLPDTPTNLKRSITFHAPQEKKRICINDSTSLDEILEKVEDSEVDPVEFLLQVLEHQGYDTNTWVAKDHLENLGAKLGVRENVECKENWESEGTRVVAFDLGWRNRIDKNLVEETSQFLSGNSANATNLGGDTILHKACRKGELDIVSLLLAHGAQLRICDESGRTPLHDACWTCSFNEGIISKILHRAPELLLATDRFGAVPFSYLSNDLWVTAKRYIVKVKDVYWPKIEHGGSTSEDASVQLNN